MADLNKVMKGLECCASCNGESCRKCPYQNESHGSAPMCTAHLAGDAFELLKSQQAEIERLKAQKQKWLQNIADQQLAVSPTGYETEEGLAKRTGEWNGLQMAWEILTKE